MWVTLMKVTYSSLMSTDGKERLNVTLSQKAPSYVSEMKRHDDDKEIFTERSVDAQFLLVFYATKRFVVF